MRRVTIFITKASDHKFREQREVGSLDELLALMTEFGGRLIVGGDIHMKGALEVMIYDDYVEREPERIMGMDQWAWTYDGSSDYSIGPASDPQSGPIGIYDRDPDSGNRRCDEIVAVLNANKAEFRPTP